MAVNGCEWTKNAHGSRNPTKYEVFWPAIANAEGLIMFMVTLNSHIRLVPFRSLQRLVFEASKSFGASYKPSDCQFYLSSRIR